MCVLNTHGGVSFPLSSRGQEGERRATSLLPRDRQRGHGFLPPPSAASAVGGWGNLGSRPQRVYRVGSGRVPAGGAVEAVVLPEWSLVSPRFPFCGDGPWSVAVVRAAFGARGSADPSGCTVSGHGRRAGGGDHAVEFLSSGSLSATVRRAPSLPWGLEDLRCRWSRLRPSPDSRPTQGWWTAGGRSGVARSWSGGTRADGRSTIQVPASSSGDSCDLKAWRCSPSQVLRKLVFFVSGVAGGRGRRVVWWFIDDVASVLGVRMYVPAYVCCAVFPFL